MPEVWKYEDACYTEGSQCICGVDEAGRGPLAGPVYAAAVILPPHLQIEGLNDSKKLSEKRREELFAQITEQALAYGIALASETEIDEINILQATFLAMQRAVAQLSVCPDMVLVDGNREPSFGGLPVKTIIKGDGLSANIAAASILAKVTRDHYMTEQAEKYPEYGFALHKGYGTRAHYAALLAHGPCPIHRRTFLRKLYGD